MPEPRLPPIPCRIIFEGVSPEIDGGRYPAKRTVGETLVVEADIFADGHEALVCRLLYRKEGAEPWAEVAMEPLVNDRWRGAFPVTEMGRYEYTLTAWIDDFQTWRRDLGKRIEVGQELAAELPDGAGLVADAAKRATGADAKRLAAIAGELAAKGREKARAALALSDELDGLMRAHPESSNSVPYGKHLAVLVDRERARFGAWYEMFPRSCAGEPDRHGTFKDAEAWLPYVAGMGFDVLYLPPIHPVGRTNRKGRNNATKAAPGDPGSPWAIGAEEGGHKAVNPELGTLDDFRRFVKSAAGHGLEVALDIALQCSPDHPYVREHPEWFRHRADGSIRYAENPPKKYEDTYPFDFGTTNWRELWEELKSVVLFWVEQGVRTFRVDNPHTKPFAFWEWLIGGVKEQYPDVIFLSEAFTRPKVMYELAKLGFTQSYTYFAWRNERWDLTEYFTELTQPPVRDFLRPNLWPNTPDILTEYLQTGGRPAFVARFVLAATLGASYGVYGPAFELCESLPREPGSEEYLNSEKYELKQWDIERPDSLREIIARVNRIRRDHAALQSDHSLRFHPTDNERLICYSKTAPGSESVIVVVNLDPHFRQSGWVDLDLERFGLDPEKPFEVHDLLSEARFQWRGARNFVDLNPYVVPAHVFQVKPRVRKERASGRAP